MATHPTGPSFNMVFDGAVNGGNYLFGKSVSIIDFIKVRTVFDSLLVLVGNFALLIVLCLDISLLNGRQHSTSSLSSSSSLTAMLYLNYIADRSPNAN